MIETLCEYLAYPFVQRALVAGILIALCASLLGVPLVLRRLSFVGDGLSHVAFGAMAVAGVLNFADSLALSIPVTAVCAVFLLRAGRGARARGDAVLAMMSVGAMAAGYMMMNLFPQSSNVSGDVCTTLFGSVSILTLSEGETWTCAVLALCVAVWHVATYHRTFDLAFDEDFARAAGGGAGLFNAASAAVLAVVVVVSMRLVGTLLVSALVVFPAVSAMRTCRSYLSVSVCAAALAVAGAAVGILASVVAGTPVGSTIVVCNVVSFAACAAVGKWRGRG